MKRGRVSSLDGLRGIAALIVMTGHVVLSGYVLALPAVRRGAGWFDRSYYPRRLTRLYLPVWGALLFAGIVHVLFARHVTAGTTPWLSQQAGSVSFSQGVQDGSLIHQPGAALQFTGVLWSLKYEVVFSLALPLVLVGALRMRTAPWLALLTGGLCLLIVGLGSARGAQLPEYMPIFVLGSLLAFHADRIPTRLWPAGAVVAVALLSVGNWDEYSALAEIKTAVAACLVVWLALVVPRFADVLSTRPVRWLGSRSYSLYLVHLPVVTALGFALGGRANLVVLWLVAAPVALLTADVFWRLVERPATLLARSVGQHLLNDDGRVFAAHRIPGGTEREHESAGVIESPA